MQLLSRMSTNKSLHRGPMDRLASFHLPLFSTCLLLCIQVQIFHALPTAISGSSLRDVSVPVVSSSISSSGPGVYSPSSFYDSSYLYRSYRPGARLNDPYRPYQKDSAEQKGLYSNSVHHPNSVYSRQSVVTTDTDSAQDLEKIFKLVEKEMITGTGEDWAASPVRNGKDIEERNKPRLTPLPLLPPVEAPKTTKEEKQEIKAETSSSPVEGPTDPLHPPPFAPEFDPEYERKQYGLGPLTLLEQAGPFW